MENVNRTIAQQQFNELVKENIDELEMDEEDAVELAVEQLVAQKVSLANIVPDIWVVKGEDPISIFTKKYNQIRVAHIQGVNTDECLEMMKTATELAHKGLNYKLYAGDCGIDAIILSFAKLRDTDEKIVRTCLECLIQLYTGYPDLLKEQTVDWLLELYGGSNDEIKRLILNLLDKGCTAHENNKQLLFSKTDLVDMLRSIVDSSSERLLYPALGIICNLSKDDDIRVEVSKAHERAVSLAEGRLCKLYDMVKEPHPLEVKVLILKALSSLTVTNQLALEVYSHDERFSIMEGVLNEIDKDKDIMTSTMKFLVALGGNDEAKCAMRPLIPLIISAINHLLGCPPVLQFAFLLISALALRNKDNAMSLIECNAVEIVLQGMKVHEKFLKVRRNGCLALRNMASSSKYLKPFEDLGVAEYVNEMISFDKANALTDVCKGVLVALGAPVDLEERWTGAHGDILSANEIASSSGCKE